MPARLICSIEADEENATNVAIYVLKEGTVTDSSLRAPGEARPYSDEVQVTEAWNGRNRAAEISRPVLPPGQRCVSAQLHGERLEPRVTAVGEAAKSRPSRDAKRTRDSGKCA